MSNEFFTPERKEAVPATDMEKLHLLGEVFRIASFDSGEANPFDSWEFRDGYQGLAIGPDGEATCSIRDGFGFKEEIDFDENDEYHIAKLRLGNEVYDFVVTLDRQALVDYAYDCGSLDETLYWMWGDIHSAKPGQADEITNGLGFISFNTQHLKVYKGLPADASYHLPAEQQDDGSRAILEALRNGDVDSAKALLNTPTHSIDGSVADAATLRGLERNVIGELDGQEVRRLTEILSQCYYVVTSRND